MDTEIMLRKYLKDTDHYLDDDESIEIKNHGTMVVVKTYGYAQRIYEIDMLDLMTWVWGSCLPLDEVKIN